MPAAIDRYRDLSAPDARESDVTLERENSGEGWQTVEDADGGGPGDEFILNLTTFDGIAVSTGSKKPIALPAPSGTSTFDPQGWLGSGSYASPDWWGDTFPEGSWVELPAGVYWAEVSFQWEEDPGVNTLVYFADVDNRYADNVSDVWQSFSTNPLNPGTSEHLTASFRGSWSTMLRIRETGAPWVWGMVAQHEQVAPINLSYVQLSLMRVSQFGGT